MTRDVEKHVDACGKMGQRISKSQVMERYGLKGFKGR
jgi:hypothetical protein